MAESCPYCGTLLTTSLKFCVNCRRSVTEDKIRQAGTGRAPDEEAASKYKLSRGASYDGLRQTRTFFFTLTSLLTIAFVYYFTMKFVIHQPIPFEEEITNFVNGMQGQMGQGGQQTMPTTPDPNAQPSADPNAQPPAQDPNTQQAQPQ